MKAKYTRIAREGEVEFAAIVRNRSGQDAGCIDYGLKAGETIDSLCDADKQDLVDTAYALARAIENATGKSASPLRAAGGGGEKQ